MEWPPGLISPPEKLLKTSKETLSDKNFKNPKHFEKTQMKQRVNRLDD
jgi:hypothetical protein